MDKYLYLPFYFDEVYEGFATMEGMIRIDTNAIVFEYQTKDALLGIVKSDTKTARIEFSEIVSIDYKKSLFSSKLFIRANIFLGSKGFPNNNANELTLKIKRNNSDLASEFVSRINLRISEARLKDIENQ